MEESLIFEIHCDLSKDLVGSIDMFVTFLVLPGIVQQETALQASIAALSDSSRELFPVTASPAQDGSTVIGIWGREDISRCFKAFSSGEDMIFRLSTSEQSLLDLYLSNDRGFRAAYDLCRKKVAEAPRERNFVDDIVDEAFGRAADDNDKDHDNEDKEATASDAQVKLGIFCLPATEDGHAVALLGLQENGDQILK